MRPEEEEWYIGIELGRKWTMASFYRSGMKEPETQSPVAGSQSYQIPTAICKKQGISQWYLAERQEGIYIDNLLEKAMEEKTVEAEGTYEARELLLVFLRKIMRMVMPKNGAAAVTRCVFSVEEITAELTEMLLAISGMLGLEPKQVLIQDNRESFYAYAVSQEPELWMYEVMLLSCENQVVTCWEMYHDKKTVPQVSGVKEQYLGELPEEYSKKDEVFTEMIQKVLNGRIVSSVYLVGEGFEGGWMKESLQIICRGRRAFQGKNLYTKGACYSGIMDAHPKEQKSVYFCEYKTKQHVFLKVTDKEQEYMYPLAEAGKNIYQIQKNICILLEGEPVLDVWIQHPGRKEAVIESLELQGLKIAPMRGCRLELQVIGKMQEGLLIKVKDIGLGEILPGSNQEWEYEIG